MSELSVKARDWIIELSGEPVESWHGRTEMLLARAANLAGISFRSARSLFYPQGHDVRSSTIERVRRAAEAKRKKEEADRDDTRDLFDRIATLETWMARVDPEFFGPQAEGFKSATSPSRSEEG